MWGDVPHHELKAAWAEALAAYSATDLIDAIKACGEAHATYPPTLPEFVGLCKSAKERRLQQQQLLNAPHTEMPDKVRKQLRKFVQSHRMPK